MYTVELAYNDLGECDTSSTTLYNPRYQLIPHKVRVFLPSLVRHTEKYVKSPHPTPRLTDKHPPDFPPVLRHMPNLGR